MAPAIRDDIFGKFKRISSIRASVAEREGLMSVRERTTWYKEFSKQVLVGRYGKRTVGTTKSDITGRKDFSKEQKMQLNADGEHPLLGTAMYLLDLWSWVPDATDEKQLQQSVLRLRVLLNDAVQLAVELVSSKNEAKKSRANPLRSRAEQKRRIGFARTLVDAAFEVPRAIAGPCEDAWCHEKKHWKPTFDLDWDRMAARILKPASFILLALDKYKQRPTSSARSASATQLIESLRVLRNCNNSYGSVLALSNALDNIPLPRIATVETAVESEGVSDFIEFHGMAQASGGGGGRGVGSGDRNNAEDGSETTSSHASTADITNVMVCLAAYLKANRIVIDSKADRVAMMCNALDLDGDLGGGRAADINRRKEWRQSVCLFLDKLTVMLRLESQHFAKDDDGTVEPSRMPLYHQLLTAPALHNTWGSSERKLKAMLEHEEGKPKIAALGEFIPKVLTKFASPKSFDLPEDVDCVVALAFKYFPEIDAELDRILMELLVLEDIRLETLLKFFAHPLIALIPARQVGTVPKLRKLCEKEATAMVASIPQITIALEICEAHEDSRPTLRMVANSIDKVMTFALSTDKSSEVMQHMLEELVGDMLPAAVRPHVTLPIIDALNGRQGLVTLARSKIGTAAKSMRMIEMTKELALMMGTKIFGVNEFITRRAVDVLQGCGDVQANTTHMQKLDTLSNERNLLQEAASLVVRSSRLNGIRTATSEYVLELMGAIYRARWIANGANFAHFALRLDNKGRMKGSMAARAKILLMTCRGAISAQHGSLLRRVVEFASAGAAWIEQPSDDVSGAAENGNGAKSDRGKGRANSNGGKTLGHFNCPSCRRVNHSFERVYGNEGVCSICQELPVDVILSDCKHLVACSRCLLQMQDVAGAADDGGSDAAAAAAYDALDGWKPPGFVYEIDGKKNYGLTHAAEIRRQFKYIYESYCMLLHPGADEWHAPFAPWSEVSKDLSENPSHYLELRKYLLTECKVGGSAIDFNFENAVFLLGKPIGAGVVKTIQAMVASTASDRLVHIQRDLILITLQTLSGTSLNRDTLLNLMLSVSNFRVRDAKTGADLQGPTQQQVESLVDDICPKPKSDGTTSWPVYGTAANLIDFIMTNSQLKERAEVVFTVDNQAARKHSDCPTPEKAIKLAKTSLMRCLKGIHTGRDYAVNLMFPLVRLMHFKYGMYGNIALLPNLTVRDIVRQEVERKEGNVKKGGSNRQSIKGRTSLVAEDEIDEEGESGDGRSVEEILEEHNLRRTGSFPVFDMFGPDGNQAERLIQATKETLFEKPDEDWKQAQETADKIGTFMSSLVQVHQRLYQCINQSLEENDDVENMKDVLFTSEHEGSATLIDKPLLTALDMVSEITLDYPKRVLIALIKVCSHLTHQTQSRLSKESMVDLRKLLADYIKEPTGASITKTDEEKDADTDGILRQRWKVTLKGTLKLQNALGEGLTVTTEVDCNLGDADHKHEDEWATVNNGAASHESLTPENERNQRACQSVALVRAWSKLLCRLLAKVWEKATQVDEPRDDAHAYVEQCLNQRLECARRIIHMLVREGSVDAIDEFDAAFNGLRVKRIVTAYYRSVLCYLAWYMGLRKNKLPWLSKMVYQMPTSCRIMDESFPLIKTGELKAIKTCYWGQFGILQYCRRVSHIIFNCRSSGIQRTDLTSIVQKLFELQRAFDVDLTDGRMWNEPEAMRSSLAERVELTDCFAINVLHSVGPLRPMVELIYLNRKLLTGTGLQSPVAFQEQYEHLADEQVSMYLRLVDRVNPALTPREDGQVSSVTRNLQQNRDNVSMSASLMEEFDTADGLGAIFGAGNQHHDGGDTMSIGSKGSAGSVRSTAGESSTAAKKNHPIMAFIPVASKLFIALARAKQGIFTWDLYEKIVRTIVMESVLQVSGCNLESPFSNLPLKTELCKILECTLAMASAESNGGDSRESALKLSSTMGGLLGLESDLVDGMLAVVDKSPEARQHALGNLGVFLARSISPATTADGGGAGGANGGGSSVGAIVNNAHDSTQTTAPAPEPTATTTTPAKVGLKGDQTMQISATISGLVALASTDFEGARQMAVKLGGFDIVKIKRLFAFCSAMHKAGMRGEEVATRTAHDPVANVKGTLTEDKLYALFDSDGNANIDFYEFMTCTKYMTFPSKLTKITAMRLFTRSDNFHSGRGLSLSEYRVAMGDFAEEIAGFVLAKRGLTVTDNRKTLAKDILTLAVINVFIFVGIVAFTTIGGFESTVNSTLPIIAGLGVSNGSSAEEVTDEDDADLLDDIDEALFELTETE